MMKSIFDGATPSDFEPRGDLFAGFESNRMIRREPSQPAIRIGLRIDVETAVENRATLGMLDQVRGHGHCEASLFAGEEKCGRQRQPSAGERIGGERHVI